MPYKTKGQRNAWYRRKTSARNIQLETERLRQAEIRRNYVQISSTDSDDSDYRGFMDIDVSLPAYEMPDSAMSVSDESGDHGYGASAHNLCDDISQMSLSDHGSGDNDDSEPGNIHSEDDYPPVVPSSSSQPISTVVMVADDDTCMVSSTTADNNNVVTTVTTGPEPAEPTIANKLLLQEELYNFMFDCQVTHSSMQQLINILNSAIPTLCLPKDPRTLINRYQPKDVIVTRTNDFAYLGIAHALEFLYAEKKYMFNAGAPHPFHSIQLSFNFDGLPTSKSTGQEVWPILMSTNVCKEYVHVVGVYYGPKKPSCSVLLKDLVAELQALLANGYKFGNGEGASPQRNSYRLYCL